MAKSISENTQVIIGDEIYTVEIADSQDERAKGLGGRIKLARDEGMLFVFDNQWFYPFWMKDMHFSLDIVWINDEFKIVDIERNIKPEDFPSKYVSIFPAKYVLEVNGGEMLRIGAQRGQEVIIRGL